MVLRPYVLVSVPLESVSMTRPHPSPSMGFFLSRKAFVVDPDDSDSLSNFEVKTSFDFSGSVAPLKILDDEDAMGIYGEPFRLGHQSFYSDRENGFGKRQPNGRLYSQLSDFVFFWNGRWMNIYGDSANDMKVVRAFSTARASGLAKLSELGTRKTRSASPIRTPKTSRGALSGSVDDMDWLANQPVFKGIRPSIVSEREKLEHTRCQSNIFYSQMGGKKEEEVPDKELGPNHSLDNRNSFRRIINRMRAESRRDKSPGTNSRVRDKQKRNPRYRPEGKIRGGPIVNDEEDFISQINVGLIHKIDKPTLDVLSGLGGRISAVLDRCTNNVSGAIDDIREVTDKGLGLAEHFKFLTWTVLACVVGYYVFFKASAHRLILLSILSSIIPMFAWEAIKPLFDVEFISQGPLSMSWVSSIVVVMMSFFFLPRNDIFSTGFNFFKFMPMYSRTVNGFQDFSSFIVENIEHCINFVGKMFGKGPVKLISTGKPEVDNFLSRFDEIASAASTQDMPPREFLLGLVELRQLGATLIETHRWSPMFERPINKALVQLDAIINTHSAALHAMKSVRVEPTLVALVGPPRIGKTLVMNALTDVLLAATLPREVLDDPKYDPKEHIYARCACNSYWTGYCRQPVVIIDDFGQALPDKGENNCYAEIINMCSPAPFCPPQAALPDKGKHYFDSKFIVASTNLDSFSKAAAVVSSTEALEQRFDLSFKVIPKRHFRISPDSESDIRLDGSKFSEEVAKTGSFPWHIWNYYVYNFKQNRIHSEPMEYREFISAIVNRWKRNQARFDAFPAMSAGLRSLGEEFRCQGLFRRKPRLTSHEVDVREFVSEEENPVDALVRIRDELRIDTKDRFQFISEWLSSPVVKVLMLLIATPILLKALFGLIRTTISSLGSLFNLFSQKGNKKKENLNTVRRMVTELDEEELDETIRDMAVRIQKKGKLGKLCSRLLAKHTLKAQSNFPNIKERKVVVSDPKGMDAQMGTSAEQINEGFARYQFSVIIHDGKEGIEPGTLTQLEDNFCMIPYHFITHLRQEITSGTRSLSNKVRLQNMWTPLHKVEMELSVFLDSVKFVDEDKDMCILKLHNLQTRKSLIDKFILKADVEHLHKIDIRLETTRIRREKPTHYIFYGSATRQLETKVSSAVPYTILNGWVYDINTMEGDCGSLATLIGNSWSGQRRIVGFHTAGSGPKGLANGLTQEYLRDVLDRLGSVRIEKMELKACDETFVSQSLAGELLGSVDLGVSQNPRTTLFKTVLHNAWHESRDAPAALTLIDGVDPKGIVMNKYLRPHLELPHLDVKRAVATAFRPFKMASVHDSRRILTLKEAAAGCPSLNNGYKGLKRGTSSGYPYNATGFSGKQDFFGKTGEFDFSSKAFSELEKEVCRLEGLARQGIRGNHIYTDFLKDELRPEEKVKTCNSRMISAAPLPYTLLFRMYFGAFTSSVEKHRVDTGPAVGINPYCEWERIVRRLKTKGPFIVAGDYGGFDHTSRPQNQDEILVNINDWYNDEHSRVRQVLWKELTNSVHLTGPSGQIAKTLLAWVGAMPSGFPGTTTINCFDNISDMILAFNKLTGLDFEKFWDYVALVVYGDDNIMSIDPSIIEKFNQITLPLAMAAIGRKYTDDRKSDTNSQPFRSIDSVTFLKRSFRKEGGSWVAPLELSSLLRIPYWGKTRVGEDKILRDMVETTLQELSLHDQPTWDRYAPRIFSIVKERMGYIPECVNDRTLYARRAGSREEAWF